MYFAFTCDWEGNMSRLLTLVILWSTPIPTVYCSM